jgi:exosome complex RNA-binding protein Csl4
MSISSYTTVTMLDSRPSPITITMPKTTDIYNRIITFKDLYGSASNSTITLVTRSGDTFEDGTFSTILSNAYQTVNLYAGQPGKWLNIDGGSGGGSSAGLTTVSNLLNSVSTNVTSVSTNLATVSNLLNSVSTNVTNVSTNLATVSNTGRFAYVSTNTVSTNLIIAGYVSSPQGYISSLVVDALSFSLSNSFISMGDIITTSVSTIQTFTSTLTTNNLKVGTVSSLNYIAFSGLQQGYNQTVIAEQATASGIQELLIFRGSTNTDRIRMQTTGPIVFEPGVSARTFPATGSNATPAMIINTSSNVGIGVAAPTVSLDVAGAGRFTAVSTQTISTNIVNAGYLVGLLPGNTAASSVSPLAVGNGNGYLSFSPQIEFQYYSGGGYKHFMGSRHYGGVTNNFGNAIDFWLYSATGGAGASTTPGTCNVNTMSVTAAGVGINQNSPSLALDVAGAGRFTAVSTNTVSTSQLNSSNISNVTNQYFQYGGSITASIGGTGGQQGFLNISYPAAGTGHTNDGTTYIWGGNANGDRFINLDNTNIGITVPKGYGNIWLNANTINVGTFDMYSNIICNVSNLNFITGASISNVNVTRTTTLSTNTISTNTLTLSNINGTGDLPITAATGCNANITGLYINLIANNVQFSSNFAMNTGTTAATYNLTAANFTRTVSLSTNTISTNTLTVGGSALSARLGIQSNATTLTSPASVIITIPNMSYFFADYTNLTNYITISNYGAQNGDYVNVVNTGNSGTPATFQILDGSTGVSTNIRYIYPGHAGVVAYSGGQWWPM